ncbi:MAG: PHP domain-containing protein [Gemmatimonadaceae bacterium]|nr:PHP domain-containing protein [Gemmatimonadaceae bacterium]
MPRDAAPRPRKIHAYVARLERLRPLRPWWRLLLLAVLVLGSAPFAIAPIREAATLGPVTEAMLGRPAGYVLLAPLSNVLDLLTLLSVRQHVALLVTLALGYAAWWWLRGRTMPPTVTPGRRAARVAARIGLPILAVLAVYFGGALLPRPMAGLEVGPDVVAIDFHAHTRYSHDGRPDWTPEDVRDWHRDAGFGAVYVSDHRTFEGARDGWSNNPLLAGQGVSLLPAIEVVWKGEHVNVLDADRMYRGIFNATLRDIDEDALRLASAVTGNEPVLIETLPGDLSRMIPARGPGTPGVRALELIDGAPKGLGQARRERARIVKLADSLDLALVAGSNHHGWGRTAAGWTLMALPGWRGATPVQLAAAIERSIRRGGYGSTLVVERYVADTERGVALPLTAPLVTWGMLRTLSTEERVAWLVWGLVLALLSRVMERRRQA